MPNTREHIPCPYKAYNGATITCKAHIDDYNAIQDDINRWIDAGRQPPEYLLNHSHRTFFMIAALAKSKPIVDQLEHAGRFGINPVYSLFAYKDGEWSLLHRSTNAMSVADKYIANALSGEHGDCLEIRCEGVRVKLN